MLFYLTSCVLNMFWTLIYPSSGARDCSIELPHWSYCSVKTLIHNRWAILLQNEHKINTSIFILGCCGKELITNNYSERKYQKIK